MAFLPGKWLIVCDVCGLEFYNDEVKERWDGSIVCEDDYEERHEQEFLRIHPERVDLPFTRPEPTDVTISVTYADTGVQAVPDGHNDGSL